MTEEERADWLARAVDDIVHGTPPRKPSETLDDGEVESLLRIARLRQDGARSGRQASLNHEAEVWQNLVARLESDLPESPSPFAGDDEAASAMSQVISMRRTLSSEALGMAEEHREEVWQRIQERIAKNEGRAPAGKRPGQTVEKAPDAQPFTSGDAELDSLVRAALARSPVPRDPEMQARLWARVGVDQGVRLQDAFNALAPNSMMPRLTPRLVGFVAAIAVAAAIIAPLPYTGFRAHPAVAAASYVGEYVGIVESTEAPPAAVDDAVEVRGVDATAEEAAIIMGLPIVTPDVPEGFIATTSRYYPMPISAADGGVFSQVYAGNEGASLVVHQEAASGAALVAADETATEVLVGAAPATYVQGGWNTDDGAFTWQTPDSQTLVFDEAGVRTIIQYTGPAVSPDTLLAVANSVSSQRG